MKHVCKHLRNIVITILRIVHLTHFNAHKNSAFNTSSLITKLVCGASYPQCFLVLFALCLTFQSTFAHIAQLKCFSATDATYCRERVIWNAFDTICKIWKVTKIFPFETVMRSSLISLTVFFNSLTFPGFP